MTVVWSPRAIGHLAALRDYIARENPGAAARTATTLLAAVDRLAELPNLGRPGRVSGTTCSARMVWAMNYQDRIVRDPQIVGGEPILKGTRVTLKTVLASLAEGATTAEILADFPTLSEEDIRAAIAFAAASAQEDLPLLETPIKR